MSARVLTPTPIPTITVALFRGTEYDITASATCDTTPASRLAPIGARRIARLYHISFVWLRRVFLAKRHLYPDAMANLCFPCDNLESRPCHTSCHSLVKHCDDAVRFQRRSRCPRASLHTQQPIAKCPNSYKAVRILPATRGITLSGPMPCWRILKPPWPKNPGPFQLMQGALRVSPYSVLPAIVTFPTYALAKSVSSTVHSPRKLGPCAMTPCSRLPLTAIRENRQLRHGNSVPGGTAISPCGDNS
jgi:hypothetical protein